MTAGSRRFSTHGARDGRLDDAGGAAQGTASHRVPPHRGVQMVVAPEELAGVARLMSAGAQAVGEMSAAAVAVGRCDGDTADLRVELALEELGHRLVRTLSRVRDELDGLSGDLRRAAIDYAAAEQHATADCAATGGTGTPVGRPA